MPNRERDREGSSTRLWVSGFGGSGELSVPVAVPGTQISWRWGRLVMGREAFSRQVGRFLSLHVPVDEAI